MHGNIFMIIQMNLCKIISTTFINIHCYFVNHYAISQEGVALEFCSLLLPPPFSLCLRLFSSIPKPLKVFLGLHKIIQEKVFWFCVKACFISQEDDSPGLSFFCKACLIVVQQLHILRHGDFADTPCDE